MKRSLLRIVLPLALVACLLTSGAVAADTARTDAADDWIVVLADGVLADQAAGSLAATHGGEVRHVYRHVLGGFSLRASARQAAALADDPLVAQVVADTPVRKHDTIPTGVSRVDAAHDDPYAGPSDREAAHDAGYRGEGTYIAVLDTGVSSSHPDLDVDTAAGIACITGSTEDVDGHGTHVAGTAAALDNGSGVVGVAPGATIIPVKVLDDGGSGTIGTVICGIEHVTALALDQVPGVSLDGPIVANASLGAPSVGGPTEDLLQQALADSVAAGVPHMTSSGNAFQNANGYVPARFPEVITVSAIADFDGIPGGLAGCQFVPGIGVNCDDEFASFSNFGSAVDITAPGVSILSTFPGGHATGSGTSMASPHVAGVAALMLASDDTLTPADIQDLLQDTGECPDGTWNTGGPVCQGQGQWPGDPDGIAEPLVNAFRAADAAADTGPDLMHASLSGDSYWTSPGIWQAEVTVTMTDDDGDPVRGARVSATWDTSTLHVPHSCVTGTDGTCSIQSHNLMASGIPRTTFTLLGAAHRNYELHPSHVGATVTVHAP